jgi:hypothetical protein
MRQRGVYEKMPGSGVWWVRYADTMGRIRREKAGTKSSALTLYRKRKTETLQGKKLPENLRSPMVSFAELAREALVYSKAHKRSYQDDVIRMEKLLNRFRDRSADSITPQNLEQHLAQTAEESDWAPATVNRYRALISLVFRLGSKAARLRRIQLVLSSTDKKTMPASVGCRQKKRSAYGLHSRQPVLSTSPNWIWL